jgi:hypothetical protein
MMIPGIDPSLAVQVTATSAHDSDSLARLGERLDQLGSKHGDRALSDIGWWLQKLADKYQPVDEEIDELRARIEYLEEYSELGPAALDTEKVVALMQTVPDNEMPWDALLLLLSQLLSHTTDDATETIDDLRERVLDAQARARGETRERPAAPIKRSPYSELQTRVWSEWVRTGKACKLSKWMVGYADAETTKLIKVTVRGESKSAKPTEEWKRQVVAGKLPNPSEFAAT